MNTAVSLTNKTGNVQHALVCFAPALAVDGLHRGLRILQRDASILNQGGRNLLARADELSSALEAGTVSRSDVIDQAVRLASELPSPQTPQLELYQRPDPAPFLEAMRSGARSILLEPSNGCENQCLFCYANTSPHMVFMPYPMFLLVIETVRSLGSKVSFVLQRTDLMLYRDILLEANAANLLQSCRDIYDMDHCNDGTQISAAVWPIEHKFAQAAAEEMHEMGIRLDALSLHLQLKRFKVNSLLPETLGKYAEHCAQAIALTRPRMIRLRGYRPNARLIGRFDYGPEHFHSDFIKRYFSHNVFPRLSPELRNSYNVEDVGPEHLPSRSNVVYRDYLVGGGEYTKKRLPPCKDLCGKMPGAVMIVYPDGSWSLEKKSILPREKGNLFERNSA